MFKNLNKLNKDEINGMLTKVLERLSRTEVKLPDEKVVRLVGQSMFRGAFIDVQGRLRLTLLVHQEALKQSEGGLVKVSSYGELDKNDATTIFVNINISKYNLEHLCEIEVPGQEIGFKSTLYTVKQEIDLAMGVLEEQINDINNIIVKTPDVKN